MKEGTNFARLSNPSSRRQAMAGVAMALGGLALLPVKAWAATTEEISHAAESIHQEADFKASRKRVYEVLMDANQFDKVIELSGVLKAMNRGNKPAEISRVVGGAFTLFG